MNTDYFDELLGTLIKEYTNVYSTEQKTNYLLTLYGIVKAKAKMYQTEWSSFNHAEAEGLEEVTGLSDKLIAQSKINKKLLGDVITEIDKNLEELKRIRRDYDLRLIDKALNPETRGRVINTLQARMKEIRSSLEYEYDEERKRALKSQLKKLEEMISPTYYRRLIVMLDDLFLTCLELWGVVCKTAKVE